MNYKTLSIEDETSVLKIFINTHDKITISIEDKNDYLSIQEMDKEDAIELRKELDYLIKLL